MPFRDSNIKTLLLDQRAPLHIPSAVRSTISNQILEFLGRVLVFNPAKRVSINELKTLKWYTEDVGAGAKVATTPAGQNVVQEAN